MTSTDKYEEPSLVSQNYENKAKLKIFVTFDDYDKHLPARTRAHYKPSQINLKSIWDFTNHGLTATWQAKMQNRSHNTVLTALKNENLADDVRQQVWQDQNPFIKNITIFGISQQTETTITCYGELVEVIGDAILEGENVHIRLHLFDDLIYKHVKVPITPNASSSTTTAASTSIPIPTNITCTGTALPNRLDINGDINTTAWYKFPPKFPSDISDLQSWWGSMIVHANANGIPWPSWHSIKLNDKMGDLIDANMSQKPREHRDVGSQHIANLFRQADYFPKSTKDYALVATLAGNDGYQALYNIADRSLIHPNLKDTRVQSTVPHQAATGSFAQHAVDLVAFIETEASNFRYYSVRDHSDLYFNTIHPTFKAAFQSRYNCDMDAHSNKSTAPTHLTPDRIPFTLEKWKSEMKVEAKSHVPPHLRQIQEDSPTLTVTEAAQLRQLVLQEHVPPDDQEADSMHALNQGGGDANVTCGYCGLQGHVKSKCTRFINHCVMNQQVKANPAEVTAILQQHSKIISPRRTPRPPPQGRRAPPGRDNQQRSRVTNRVRQLHEVLTSESSLLALSQIPDASPSDDNGDEAISL